MTKPGAPAGVGGGAQMVPPCWPPAAPPADHEIRLQSAEPARVSKTARGNPQNSAARRPLFYTLVVSCNDGGIRQGWGSSGRHEPADPRESSPLPGGNWVTVRTGLQGGRQRRGSEFVRWIMPLQLAKNDTLPEKRTIYSTVLDKYCGVGILR